MGCIIVMMPREDDSIRLKDIIRRSGIWENVLISRLGSETLEIAGDRDVSVVICTKKMPDMGYEELCSYLPESISLLLLTKDAALVPFSENVIKLLTPFQSGELISSIRMLLPKIGSSVPPKKKRPERNKEEQKIIDEAKAVLMKRNDMTEPQAFRYIQKTSMDASRTMLETAQMILLLNEESSGP